jgi:plasmid stabilization system protein ParE
MGLEMFPGRGRIGRVEGTRELVFAPLPCIAVYRVTEEAVEILRIYHSAQDWPCVVQYFADLNQRPTSQTRAM